MAALKLFFIILPVILVSLMSKPAKAEEVGEAPMTELPQCAPQFVADFDKTGELFLAVGLVIDSKADDHAYRTSLVTALNSCHSFVEKYVKVDAVTNEWVGQACTRVIEESTVTIEPRSHKAECEYLQRLLNRADQ